MPENTKKPSAIERVKLALEFYRNGTRRIGMEGKKAPYAISTWRTGNPQWQVVDYDAYVHQGFNANSLIYSAVMYKAKAIAQVMLRAYKGTLDEPEPLYMPHPLVALCMRPNPSMSMPEFLATQEVYLNLSGNAYTYIDHATRGGPPSAMYPLRPDKVRIIPNADGTVKGYLYGDKPILPELVSHIKLPNPGDELDGNGYGLPPMSAAATAADTDNLVSGFIHKFFEQGAVIPGLLKFNVPLSPEIVQRIKDTWSEQHGGTDSWMDVGVLDNGGEYQRIGLPFTEMGFAEQDERNETRILAPFGVPPILIGSRIGLARSTYANYKEARQAFWEDTMSFELALFEGDLLYYLRSEDGGFTLFDTSSVPALRKDVAQQVTAYTQLFINGIPKREAARQAGLEIDFKKIPDADVVYMPMSVYPVGNVGSVTEPTTPQGDEMEDAPEATEDAEEEKKKEALILRRLGTLNKLLDHYSADELQALLHDNGAEESKSARPFDPVAKEMIWKAIDKTATKWERAFVDGARRSFERDKRNVLAALTATVKAARHRKASIDWGDFSSATNDYIDGKGTEAWRETFTPLMRGVISDQNDAWSARLGLTWDAQNLFARDWFNNYTLTFAQEINNTTKNEIAAIIAQAQAQGWTVNQMQQALDYLFERYINDEATPPEDAEWYLDRTPSYRTEAIARTETIRSSNAGSQQLFGDWGVKRKEWLATYDSRARESHMGFEPKVVGIDEPFMIDGDALMFPGDPSAPPGQTVNCRCALLPVMD